MSKVTVGANRGNLRKKLAEEYVKRYHPEVWAKIVEEAASKFPYERALYRLHGSSEFKGFMDSLA